MLVGEGGGTHISIHQVGPDALSPLLDAGVLGDGRSLHYGRERDRHGRSGPVDRYVGARHDRLYDCCQERRSLGE